MNTEKHKTTAEHLSEDIMRIMTLERNKENYAKFQDTIKDLKPKKCIVKFGWASGDEISFSLIFEKYGNEDPFDEFIKGIEDKEGAFNFIMGLDPTIFHFNLITVVNIHEYLMLTFNLKRYE